MSDWYTLSPPGISGKQCQKLVDKYFQEDEPLAGRPVMIPFTKQAFVMGELQPVTQNSGTRCVECVKIRPGKEKTLQTLSANDAKQWLLKKAPPTQPPATVHEPKPSSTPHANKTESQSSNRTTMSSAGSQSTAPQTKNQKSAPSTMPFHPTMVEIHEEFNEDGTQTKGDVVNVTSEFQALMDKIGQGDAMKFPQEYNGETKEETTVDDSGDDQIMADYDAPLKELTDPEYDQLAKRLDELARLEELENERLQQGARHSKLKAKRATANKSKSSGGGSGGWNKGFLNQPKKKKSAKKTSTAEVQPINTSTTNPNKPLPSSPPSSDQVTADASKSQAPLPIPPHEASSPDAPAGSTTVTKQATTGGVAFDLTQNKVQEIPSLPGTRPIPPRNSNLSMPTRPAIAPPVDQPPRMMDSSVFSGVIQERSTVGAVVNGGNKVNQEANNIIQERSAPQSFRRRRQQQEQRQPQVQDPNKPKKKLSRFAQERMG